MKALKELMIEWQSLKPLNGSCCAPGHFDKRGDRWMHRKDEYVCPRELAWRKYVRVRDNDPTWPSRSFDIVSEEDLP